MPYSAIRTIGVLSTLVLLGLNIAMGAFYALWRVADDAAINRMESSSGMDPTQLLPNGNLMWLAAHSALLMLVVLDILAVILAAIFVSFRRNNAIGAR